jgi:hypothetical protein
VNDSGPQTDENENGMKAAGSVMKAAGEWMKRSCTVWASLKSVSAALIGNCCYMCEERLDQPALRTANLPPFAGPSSASPQPAIKFMGGAPISTRIIGRAIDFPGLLG